MPIFIRKLYTKQDFNTTEYKGVIDLSLSLPWHLVTIVTRNVASVCCTEEALY